MKCGHDVRIAPEAILKRKELICIGNHVAIDAFTLVTTRLTLGDYVHIGPHCSIIGGEKGHLVMEDFSSIAAGCRIVCSSDDYTGLALNGATIPLEFRVVRSSTITVGKFASVGTNVVILPGVRIGEGAAVGAGCVVTKNLEPWGIYAGPMVERIGTRARHRIVEMARQLTAEP